MHQFTLEISEAYLIFSEEYVKFYLEPWIIKMLIIILTKFHIWKTSSWIFFKLSKKQITVVKLPLGL